MNTNKKTRIDAAMTASESVLPSSAVVMLQGTVRTVIEPAGHDVVVGDTVVSAAVGVMLPTLVAGDVVVLAHAPGSASYSIVGVLSPAACAPWVSRSIALTSDQSITLTSGATTFKLTAAGLARIVALSIEHDARDLFDVDAAEIRLN